VIVREIRAPQPPEAPPMVIRQRPPNPVTPPPIVIRERPPVPPPIEPPRIVTKYLPAPPPPPRKVIIERQAPLPQKPQPIIIEKWLPYKPSPERRVVVERAPALVQTSTQRNTVITYDAPQVDFVKNVRDLGIVRADPRTYSVQYGSQLASSEYVLNTMAKFGLGNNYSQMIQMQTSPRPSISSHQSVTNDDHSAYQLQNGDYSEYIEKHVEEIVSPNSYRKLHSSNSSSNEQQDVYRYAELYN
jgi:outer membrane biosynthesis protein TonB